MILPHQSLTVKLLCNSFRDLVWISVSMESAKNVTLYVVRQYLREVEDIFKAGET